MFLGGLSSNANGALHLGQLPRVAVCLHHVGARRRFLRISEGATITVNGVFDAGEATLSSTGYGRDGVD